MYPSSRSLLNRTTWARAWVRKLVLAMMTTCQQLLELPVEQLRLVETGLDGPLHRGFLQVLRRQVVVIHLAAILAMGAPPSIGASVGAVQCPVVPRLGNQG